jgi:hypothetical protein
LRKIDHGLSFFITLGEPRHFAKRNSPLYLRTPYSCWGGRGHSNTEKDGRYVGWVKAPGGRNAVEFSLDGFDGSVRSDAAADAVGDADAETGGPDPPLADSTHPTLLAWAIATNEANPDQVDGIT